MSADTILAELRQERAVKLKDCESLQARIAQLTRAIDALEGRAEAVPIVAAAEKSVTNVVEDVVRTFASNEVFDISAIKTKAIQLQPDMRGRITRGIYNAVNAMVKHAVIRRCPGGFCLNEAVRLSA